LLIDIFLQVEKVAWYIFPALVGHYLAFFGGIMFMLCYYIWFHPTGIEMPSLFKFLKRPHGGAAAALGPCGDRGVTATDGGATAPERIPLTFFKVKSINSFLKHFTSTVPLLVVFIYLSN
jgi:hypothetical protein